MLSSLFQESFLNKIARSLKRLQNIVMLFDFRIFLFTVHKSVGLVKWLDVILKKEDTMIIFCD
jgi:hypothetical protein